MPIFDLPTWMAIRQEATEQYLSHLFNQQQKTVLSAAMQHSSLAGGKRIRPLLLFSVAEMVEISYTQLLAPACALELIHCYSLIHDDLPAMDDDDLRRGKPSCHKQFDEATAILAGDALQALAFSQIAQMSCTPEITIQLLNTLAQAAKEMVLGQALDMDGKADTIQTLEAMHQYKTGALISAALIMGGQSAAMTAEILSTLTKIGESLGLAFQIQDDILDVTADSTTLGKPRGSDEKANKATYVSLLGLDMAQTKMQTVYQQAQDTIQSLPFDTQALQALAKLIVQRKY